MEDIVAVMETYIYNNVFPSLEAFTNYNYELVKTYIARYENIVEAKRNLQNEFKTTLDNVGLGEKIAFCVKVDITKVYQEATARPSILGEGLRVLRGIFGGESS